jgi:putative component of membrane protein insertase Oxa1/YidC/SpoIIIJ protein YidD
MPREMKTLLLSAIRLYQRMISPRKGFSCAYRVHTSRASCSALGYRAIQRFGVWRGIAVLRKRLAKCEVVHRRHAGRHLALRWQEGFCDVSCDLPCDASDACNLLSNCDVPSCNCRNWWSSRRKRQSDEQWVHMPPNSTRPDA